MARRTRRRSHQGDGPEFLFRKATTDGAQAVTAAIFWLKTRGGWKETSVTELAGKEAEPVKMIVRAIISPDSGATYQQN